MAKPPAKTSKSCFFITPIGAPDSGERRRADWIFHHVIEPVAKSLSLIAERADLMSGSAMISTNIFKAISEAPVCVADLTGLNANVFYEIGVRHSLKLPIIHLAQAGTALPFDTAPHLTHFYDLADYASMAGLKDFLSKEMKVVTEDDYAVSNPFTHALGNIEISRSGDPKDKIISRLEERVSSLENSAHRGDKFQLESRHKSIKTIIDFLEFRENTNQEFHVNALLVRDALNNLTLIDDDIATDLYFRISSNYNITNRDKILSLIKEAFPSVPIY